MDRHSQIRSRRRWLPPLVVGMIALVLIPGGAFAGDRFSDVPTGHVFHDDIAAIADAGVTLGCNPPANTAFCPGDGVTRGQMAAFLNRLGALSGQTPVVNAATAVTATSAATAATATSATTADSATTAATATTALTAADADTVDGKHAADFVGQGEADAVSGGMVADGSLSSADMSDAAGVAQATLTTAVDLTAASPAVESVLSVAITAPASGYVIVTASMQAKGMHVSGTPTHLTIDVSSSATTLPAPGNTKNYVVPAATVTGDYTIVTSVQRAFPVGAGLNTFYLVANEVSGDGEIDDVTLTVLYVPLAHGTVSQ